MSASRPVNISIKLELAQLANATPRTAIVKHRRGGDQETESSSQSVPPRSASTFLLAYELFSIQLGGASEDSEGTGHFRRSVTTPTASNV